MNEWSVETPYQIKSIGIRDACLAVKTAKAKFKTTGQFQQVQFRSRKAPVQSLFVPSTAISSNGVYYTMLGRLQMAEPLPSNPKDSRLTCHNGRYFLCVPFESPAKPADNQGGRVVSLDPGVRSFLTWYGEAGCGKIGHGDFTKLFRLCLGLDDLISRTSKTVRQQKRRMHKAQARLRNRIGDLVDELHWKACRFLTSNFDVILLPSFETQEMACRGKLRSKTVRSMLGFQHYRFQQRLLYKAAEMGKRVVLVDESYTSKTASWTGEVVKIGSRKEITSAGVTLDRDINGARGIFVKTISCALRDTSCADSKPALHS